MTSCLEKPLKPQPWLVICGKPATETREVDGKKEQVCKEHAKLIDRKSG